ncbi:glycosyl transferase family 28 [Nocardioides sp. GY 10113]|uniref:glycosyltransferase n=1 Tax=Nocardioides sp. GY 10113 TaxID=2569761 RepID=UPI0010A8CCE8|nr:glycosyltransferase [Nocardioides sp. GY 10113]TIC81533.1 glycosyl transferase family 28 [Nocardioides sp. GY 10113]
MRPTLLVASPGGHLDELMIMVDLLGVDTSNAVWVTGRTSQSESLLADREVVWVPRVGSGQMWKAAAGLPAALRLQQRIKPELLVSTGALFSTPHLLAATLRGCETWFVDSATRVLGPSSTGRFAQRLTRARLFVQGEGWGDDAWTPVPNVFDAFEAHPQPGPVDASRLRTGVVSLGTELWPFDRAVESCRRVLAGLDLRWQTGTTEAYADDGSPLTRWMPATELHAAFGEADVVVTHAGVGSVLSVLQHGKVPVILPRRASRSEMVDDHQLEFAAMIDAKGLAVSVDPDDLTLDHVLTAAGLAARRRPATATAGDQIPRPRR